MIKKEEDKKLVSHVATWWRPWFLHWNVLAFYVVRK